MKEERTEKVAVIIPAYNEESAIASVIDAVNALDRDSDQTYVPIVVNDCSKDRTADIIDSSDCIPIHLPVNLGIGGAVQTGFIYAFDNGFHYAVQIDGDGQHPSEQVPRMLEEMHTQGSDIVIGSRFLSNEGFRSTLARRMGIRYFHRLNKWLVGVSIKDSTSGMRLLNRKALEVVSRSYPDEYPEPEAIILYVLSGLKVSEVSVEMNERQGGVSSIGNVGSIYYMVKVTLAVFFTYLRLKSK